MSDEDGPPLSELFAAFADWCCARGLGGAGHHEFNGPGGMRCRLNATSESWDAIPPFNVAIEGGPILIALLGPYGGAISPPGKEGLLIELFRAATPDD